MGTGMQRRRVERSAELLQPFGGLSRRPHLSRRDRDLDLRRQEANGRPLISLQFFDGRADRGQGGTHLPFAQPNQREGRVRSVTERVGLPERVLRSFQVTHPKSDLSQRVEAVGQRWAGAVRAQLLGGLAQLLLGAFEAALEPLDLGPVDPADAGESVDRLPLAPPASRLGPLPRPPVVGGVPSRRDHLAVRHPGRERAELAVHRGHGGLFQQSEAFLGPPGRDQHRALLDQPPGLQVVVAVLRAELDRPGRQLDPEVDLTHRLRDHAPRQCLITVRVALLVTFDQPLTAVQPRRGDGELTPDAVVPKDVECEERSACLVPGVNLRLECALLRLEREVGLRAEPGRLGQRFQVVGPEGALAVGLGQEVERLLPAVRLERLTRRARGRGCRFGRGHTSRHCATRPPL